MTPIPPTLKKEILADQTYKTCMLYGHHGHVCDGRITLEHAIRYAGRQVQARWAIIACCAKGQEVDQFQDGHTMNKEMNEWCAYGRATAADLQTVIKSNPQQRMKYLNAKYGTYVQKFPVDPALQGVKIEYPSFTKRPLPAAVAYGGKIYVPVSKDIEHINAIKKHCREVESIGYTDDKIISMALEAYAKELEAVAALVS